MRIEFIKKNYDMPVKLGEITTKKLEKLSRYFDDSATCKVTLKKQNEIYKMEVAIYFSGMFMRAEVSSDNMYDNIDVVIPKVEKQIFKYRTKLQKQFKSGAFKDMALEPKETESKVVRIKQIDLKPMHLEDAAMELDLVDHDFYVFIDEKTKDVNIVYRRADGDLGLLQPN